MFVECELCRLLKWQRWRIEHGTGEKQNGYSVFSFHSLHHLSLSSIRNGDHNACQLLLMMKNKLLILHIGIIHVEREQKMNGKKNEE